MRTLSGAASAGRNRHQLAQNISLAVFLYAVPKGSAADGSLSDKKVLGQLGKAPAWDSLETLIQLEMAPDGSFFQVHRTAIIRRDVMRELRLSGSRRELVLSDGAVVPVSRAHWNFLKQTMA